MFIVAHPDGRRVYWYKRVGRHRFYVRHSDAPGDGMVLCMYKSRRYAEKVCARTNEVWGGFGVVEI